MKCVLVNTISSVLSLLSLRFAFVEYDSHRAAAMARRKLMNGRVYLWGHQLAVDWAEPELEVDEEIMAQVRYSMEHVLPQHPWYPEGGYIQIAHYSLNFRVPVIVKFC